MSERYEVTIIDKEREESYRYDSLDAAYAFYLTVKGQPAEVALHDLEEQVTITDNTYGE